MENQINMDIVKTVEADGGINTQGPGPEMEGQPGNFQPNSYEYVRKLDLRLITAINVLGEQKVEARLSRTYTELFQILTDVHLYLIRQLDGKK